MDGDIHLDVFVEIRGQHHFDTVSLRRKTDVQANQRLGGMDIDRGIYGRCN